MQNKKFYSMINDIYIYEYINTYLYAIQKILQWSTKLKHFRTVARVSGLMKSISIETND
jgi:hypothetical protein